MNLHSVDKLGQAYLKEANICAETKLYLASCILYGAALEALLLETCYLYQEQVKLTAFYKKKMEKVDNNFLNLGLNDLINISAELKWFKEVKLRSGEEITVTEMMKLVKEIRNLVHPGKWCRDYKNVKISEGHYQDVSAVMSEVIKQLIHLPFSDGNMPDNFIQKIN